MANANEQVKSMVQSRRGQNNPTLKVNDYGKIKIVDVEIPVAILEDGEPFIPWKTFVEEGLKTDWKTQRRKEQELKEKGCSILELPFQTKGGIQNMKAISLFDIPAFLYTVSPNKVRPELRKRVREVQIETTKAIRNYWKEKFLKEKEEIEKARAEYNRLVQELRQIPTYEEYKELKVKYELLSTMVDMIVLDIEKVKPNLQVLFQRINQIKNGVTITSIENGKPVNKVIKF